MMTKWRPLILLVAAGMLSAACVASLPYGGGFDTGTTPSYDPYARLAEYAAELENRTIDIVEAVSNQVIDTYGAWSDDQIAVLFASEGFASSSRVFRRLTERAGGSASRTSTRPGLERALRYVVRDYEALESASRLSGIRLYALTDCAAILRRIERELGVGPSFNDPGPALPPPPVLEDWDGKYAKGRDAAVFLIEKGNGGVFLRRPFKNLESLFKYNYDQDRGKNPWDHLVEIPAARLDRMRAGTPIVRTFEGLMLIEQGTKPDRSVYLIRNGKKHGLTRPELVARFGGWKKVFEVPRDVIAEYPDGDPIR